MKATKLILAATLVSSLVLGGVTAHAAESTTSVELTSGNLMIDHVPDFNFQSIELSNEVSVVSLLNSENPTVQVTDSRGSGTGWELSVAQTQVLTTMDEKPLKGSSIMLPLGEIDTPTANVSEDPTASSITINDQNQVLIKAENGEGMGTWYNEMAKDEVILSVPSGNLAGDYVGELMWTLVAAP